ncbi:hypothetical protein LIER_02597 [Lithospermum erythrorhizon]|uniref:Uncharacterized protein n=1 Tax=Lithospermum erythrorhizon TaxID=34254 RepID=A0AAV3NQ42_LITER
MAKRFDEGEFWLPAEFLSDEDILMSNKDNLNNNKNLNNFHFPSEFPFDFDQVVNSTNVEDHLVELTRQLSLHKSHQNYQRGNYAKVGSPQSTLFQFGGSSNGGSPNDPSQVSSPTSHFAPASNSSDLIYQAAAQVARLKIKQALNNSVLYNAYVQRVREEQILKHQQQRENVWSNNQSKDFVIQQQKQNGFSGVNVGAYLENEKSVWPSLQCMMQQNQQKRSGNGGSGNGHLSNVKKPSAGTGVFIPRLYGSCINEINGGFETRKNKMTGSTTSLHGLGERSYPHVIGGGHALPQWQPRRGGGLCSDYELQLAHKNAMLMHQRSSHLHQQVAISHELGLPQEWTY